MPVDKSKQIYGWWANLDIEIVCSCGDYIQNNSMDCDGTDYYSVCKNCGQRWLIKLIIKPVEDK